MSLIIAAGSNIGNSMDYLKEAKAKLCQHFKLVAASGVYRSAAVDYEAQPDFLNQVFEFKLPASSAEETMLLLLDIELSMGRKRDIPKGPRTIDLDIIFWGTQMFQSEQVTIPHPRWRERSFIVRPLQELPFFQTLAKSFTIPKSFKVEAFPFA